LRSKNLSFHVLYRTNYRINILLFKEMIFKEIY